MMITKEEYLILDKHIRNIELIVRNSAISQIPIDFRNDCLSIAKKYKIDAGCDTCNRSFALTVSRLYNKYLEYKNNNKTDGNNKKRKPKGKGNSNG